MSLINSTAIPSGVATGYEIGQSLRFNNPDNAYLSRTFVTPTNRKIWTFSVWLKRSVFGAYPRIFSTATGAGGNTDNINFMNDDKLRFISDFGQLTTTQVFRDPSAWYHIMYAFDSTQSTEANRLKLYVNGTQVTSFTTANYPTLNDEVDFNSAIVHDIGRNAPEANQNMDGYLAEINFIDGQALTPADFGTTGTYGEWKPKEYSGSYGTNGFYLNFAGGGIISSATGGNSTGTTGDYKYKTYTSNGTFTPSNDGYVEYLVVGGGGGGGSRLGGGGGGGGFKKGFLQLTGSTAYTVTVGAGGGYDASGNNSSVSGTGITTLTAIGGGHGGAGNAASATGGSGGGGAGITSGNTTGSAGNSGQGNAGGNGAGSAGFAGGGGGGAGAVGANGPQSGKGGDGGAGLQSNIDTNNYYYSGGGGGGAHFDPSTGAGNGGIGGGGGGARGGGSTGAASANGNGTGGGSARNSGASPADNTNQPGGAGGANTGGGGGGAPNNPNAAGAGGSGIVIIRYKFQ